LEQKSYAQPALSSDQPVHRLLRPVQHRASGAEPGRAGPEPGSRLTSEHDTGDPSSTLVRIEILVYEQFWLRPGACIGPSDAEPGHAGVTPGKGFLFQNCRSPYELCQSV
jgi:hypothetical protein